MRKLGSKRRSYSLLATLGLAAVALAITLGLPVGDGDAHAAGFVTSVTIDDYSDAADFDPGDGVCDTDDSVGDGPCTLRAAIQEANASGPGPHEILLDDPSGDAYVHIPGAGEDLAATGDLDIATEIRIQGTSANDRDDLPLIQMAGAADRVFHILPGGKLTISEVRVFGNNAVPTLALNGAGFLNQGTLEILGNDPGGHAFSRDLSYFETTGQGGTIFNDTDAELLIENRAFDTTLLFSESSADEGGFLYNLGNAVIRGAQDANGESGSAVSLYGGEARSGAAIFNAGTLNTACHTVITESQAEETGGGVHNASSGVLDIETTLIQSNSAEIGGGIYNNGSATVGGSTDGCDSTRIVNNAATASGTGMGGGGIFNTAELFLEDLELSYNTAEIGGGFLQAQTDPVPSTDTYGITQFHSNTSTLHGGGLAVAGGTFTSEFLGMTSPSFQMVSNKSPLGAAISVDGAGTSVVINHSILQSNAATASGGAIAAFGGQLEMNSGIVLGNTAGTSGGSVFTSDDGTALLSNFLFYLNQAPVGSVAFTEGLTSRTQLLHTTIHQNDSDAIVATEADTLFLSRSLILDQDAPYCSGPVMTDDYNAFETNACASGATDVIDPDVVDYSTNGYTIEPNPENPVVDMIGDCLVSTDIDQKARPQNGNGATAPGCDAGAWEAAAPVIEGVRSISGTITSPAGVELGGICAATFNEAGALEGVVYTEVPDFEVETPLGVPVGLALLPCDGGIEIDYESEVMAEWDSDVVFVLDPLDSAPPAEATIHGMDRDVSGLEICLGIGPTADVACAVEQVSTTTTSAPTTTTTTSAPNSEISTTSLPSETTTTEVSLDTITEYSPSPPTTADPLKVSNTGAERGTPGLLAFTGSSVFALVLSGILLVLAGTYLGVRGRRRS